MNEKLIITGGSGLIGHALQNSLYEGQIDCIGLTRNGSPPSSNSLPWNPAQPEMPIPDVSPLEGCQFAVHLAGANLASHRWTANYKKTIQASRLDSSRALIHIFSRLQSPPRVLVCASATGIYGDRGEEVLTEESKPGTGFLPDVCQAWERSSDAAAALGIRVIHLRFGVVLTSKGGALPKLLPVFKSGLGGRLGDGRQWMSWVALDDVVRGILFALQTESLHGAYNLVAPMPITNREFTATLAKALHRPAPWIVPEFALKLLFGQMAQDTLLASTRALPAELLAAGFAFKWPDLQAALAELCKKKAP